MEGRGAAGASCDRVVSVSVVRVGGSGWLGVEKRVRIAL